MPKTGQVQPGRDEHGFPASECRVEQGQALLRGQGRDARAGHPRDIRLRQVPGHTAGLLPQAPGERGGGQPLGPAMGGEAVEAGVGGGVVGLARVTDRGDDGREQQEGGQTAVPRQLVQVPRRISLAPEDVGQPLRSQAVEGAVVQRSRSVDDGGQGVLGGDGAEEGGEGVAVGDVAGGDGGMGAQGGELGVEAGGVVGGGPASADEQEVADTVLGHQVAGEEGAQASGAAGDQYGAVGVQYRGLCGGGFRPSQTWYEEVAIAEGELRLSRGQRRRQDTVIDDTVSAACAISDACAVSAAVGSVDVQQDDTAGLLRLSRSQQPPDGCRGEVRDVLPGQRGEGATGGDDQTGIGETRIRQPVLDRTQRVAEGGVQLAAVKAEHHVAAFAAFIGCVG